MRALRFTRPGAIYHITCRANHKEELLGPPVAKEIFIEVLGRLRMKYGGQTHDFVVMDNHVHLLFEPRGEAGLAENMKWLFGVYSMSYNRVFKTWGSVWGGRYFSRPIGGIGDLARAVDYIDANPVRALLAPRPEDWRWGGLWMHRQGDDRWLGGMAEWMTLLAPRHRRLRLGV